MVKVTSAAIYLAVALLSKEETIVKIVKVLELFTEKS
jgi:hypothetical protein